MRGENWSLNGTNQHIRDIDRRYAKELWKLDDFSKIKYRWYRDNVLIDEGYNISHLDINENEVKGIWKVEADYIDDYLLKNTINSSLDITQLTNKPIQEKVKIVLVNNPNENRYLSARYDFNQANGGVKETVFYHGS